MMEGSRKENMHDELSRADEAIKAADLLFDNDLVSDAISRLYYFILYHIRALLLSRGLEPRSHEGTLRLLGLHFIREGFLEKSVAQVFSKLMKFREEADYNPVSMFSKEDYVEYRKEAMILADAIKRHLGR